MKTEQCQKVLHRVSFPKLHIVILKKDTTGFSVAYSDNVNVSISDYDIRLTLPSQLRNMNQGHQIICGCKICIQDGTYQELLNHWRKRRLRYIKNNGNSLTRGSAENLNAETIFTMYSDVVLPDGELKYPRSKYDEFYSMCDFPGKGIKFPKWLCVLNCCIEFTGVFVCDEEIINEDGVDLRFILFRH